MNERTEKQRLLPTSNEYLDFLLETYHPAEILSEKEGKRVIVLEHRNMNGKLVARFLARPLEIYGLLLRIRHEYLPAVYDVIDCSDGQIVLEEYISGVNAAQVLQTGLYTYAGAKNLLLKLCSALTVLHERGFVHRDIKPENVMISDDGKVKLIDFDAARRFEIGKSGDTTALGTVGFAPPEQYGIAQSSPQSDVYALGVLLNVLLTGEHPAKKLAPGKAGKIVLRCTQINTEKRYDSVKDLGRAL